VDAVDDSRLRQINPEKYGEDKWNLSNMPRFSYQQAWPELDIQTALVDIISLAFWGMLFFAGACVAMPKYDSR
jgi:hypothetical protein